MSEELSTGLAATANEPVADSQTPDSVLDAAFASPEPAAGSEPSNAPEPVPEPAAAIAQPQTPEQPSGAKGEPPRERWDSILENARTKAREEALAAHKDQLEIVQRLREDFAGTVTQLLEEGSIDPRFSEALTSKAAAILAARNKAAKADSEPEPDLQTADGALVYSADQLRKWHQWNSTQTEKKLAEQFRPLQELQQQLERVKQDKRDQDEAMSVAEERGAEWKDMPMFKDHKDAIMKRQIELNAAAMEAAQRGEGRYDQLNTPWAMLQRAYREVISTQALPKLQSQQTDNLVAQAARKRAGSSSDPVATAPAQPRRPRTPDEAVDLVFNAYIGA